MKNILFSLEAVSKILIECYKSNNNLETGGILVGPRQHKNIITDVLPSTSFAERRQVTYYQSAKDVYILNRKLKIYHKKGCDFRGYFHKHPSGMFQLSNGDNFTCIDILKNPNYKINNHLIMCIVTESPVQDFPMFLYVVSLDYNNETIIKKSSIKVLPKTCILECAECFEPSEKGANHEIDNNGQDPTGTQEQTNSECSVVRNTEKQSSDSKFTSQEKDT